LVDALPAIVEPAADVTSSSQARTGSAVVSQIGAQLGELPERARYLAQAVLKELQTEDRELIELFRTHLPPDTVDVLEEAGEPPEVAETATPDRPTRLTADQITAALKKRLPDWTGDETGLSRTVGMPDDRMIPLVARVERVARAMNDHAHVERSPGSITFVLRTGPASVTEPDLALAERIDEAIADIGSGGRPG
jgi:pterin-4a-carbinolamine dehydratase